MAQSIPMTKTKTNVYSIDNAHAMFKMYNWLLLEIRSIRNMDVYEIDQNLDRECKKYKVISLK